ncbi:7402_t:CDS:2, partial [Dentiscutata heterogama]
MDTSSSSQDAFGIYTLQHNNRVYTIRDMDRPRQRAISACYHCRRQHRGCNNYRPCNNCRVHGYDCNNSSNEPFSRDSVIEQSSSSSIASDGNQPEDQPSQINDFQSNSEELPMGNTLQGNDLLLPIRVDVAAAQFNNADEEQVRAQLADVMGMQPIDSVDIGSAQFNNIAMAQASSLHTT